MVRHGWPAVGWAWLTRSELETPKTLRQRLTLHWPHPRVAQDTRFKQPATRVARPAVAASTHMVTSEPAYRSPAYRCPACCDRCQQVLSTGGASNTGSGGRPLFFSRHRGAGPTTDCVRPERSRGGAFEQRAGVAAGPEPARTVVEGRVRLLGFAASHHCPPIPRTAPHCAYGQRLQRCSPTLNGAHVPPQLGDAAAAFQCRQELCTRAVTPYLEHSLQFLEELCLMKWFVEAATLRS